MDRSLLLAALIASTAANAQTITQADMPSEGESFQFINASYLPMAATGEDQTWDMSTVTSGPTSVLDCVLPSATSYETDFPTADLALLQDEVQQFARIDASGMYLQGMWNGYIPALVTFTDEYKVIPFPCTYGTTFTDTYGGGYDFQGDHVVLTGDVNFTADGYGTLILPWGTVTNVLKFSGTETSNEALNGDDYGNHTNVVYFFKPGVDWFIVKAMDITISLNGEPTNNVQAMTYMSQASVGVEELLRNDIGMDVYPVPAHDRLNVVYALDGGQATTLTLCDASGRAVRTLGSVTGATGVQRADLDVAGLPAGMYLLRITDGRGQRGMRKVVIE